jgi:hypothetical protein
MDHQENHKAENSVISNNAEIIIDKDGQFNLDSFIAECDLAPFSAAKNISSSNAPVVPEYKLHVRPMKVENRVETECQLELVLSGPKIRHNKIHLAPNLVWLAKNLAGQGERRLEKDTLELSAVVVRLSEHDDYIHPPVDFLSQLQADITPFPSGLLPIPICQQCQKREHARKNRKKNPVDVEFDSYISQRIIGIAAKEYSPLHRYIHNAAQPWDKFTAERPSDQGPFPVPDFGADQVSFQAGMRILCKCNHHAEKKGFLVRFTLKDAYGCVVAEATSSPIMVKDVSKKSSASAREAKKVEAQPTHQQQLWQAPLPQQPYQHLTMEDISMASNAFAGKTPQVNAQVTQQQQIQPAALLEQLHGQAPLEQPQTQEAQVDAESEQPTPNMPPMGEKSESMDQGEVFDWAFETPPEEQEWVNLGQPNEQPADTEMGGTPREWWDLPDALDMENL